MGGAARVAMLQEQALKQQGHEVRVWSNVTPYVYTHPLARLWFHLVTDAKPRADIVRDVLAWKPDELHTHNLTGMGFGTPKAIQAHGIRWQHTLHDIQLTDPSGQETDAWSKTILAKCWRAFWSARRRAVFGTPDTLISPTAWLLNWHHAHGFRGKEERIVRNPRPNVNARHRERRIPATVLYVGRLSREKGFDRFLEITQQLPSSLVNQITVVGAGPLAERAMRLNDPRLDLVGAVPPETVQELMMQADLLIAPSRLLENQQTILLEAMAAGTPVVATDTGGTNETLEGTGCPVVSEEQLKDAVIHLLSDKEAWQQTAQQLLTQART